MIASLLIACLGAAPAPTAPDSAPATPREVARAVAALLEAGKINEAFAYIDAANEADPDPRYLFMRASLEEQLGRCSVAIPLYREFYAQAEAPMDRDEAQAGLARCDAEPLPEPDPRPASGPPPALKAAPSPQPAPPTPPPPASWQRDPWGWTLLGTGFAVTATGGTLLALGRSAARETGQVALQTQHADAARRAGRLQPAGIGLVATGSALWVVGVVRMVVVDRRDRASRGVSGRIDGFSIFF